MYDTDRQQTLHMESNPSREHAGLTGRVLQIYPVDLESGLITFKDEPFIIGRDPHCDLMIGERSVSRQHAKFDRTSDGFMITDLDSTNGTCVNGVRITSQELRSGDRIRIGGRIFKYIATDQLEAHYHEAVYSMMTKDSLTQTWNKRYLLETLKRELKRRERTRRDLSLMVLDLDYFKKVNDTYGHLVGDELLRQTSERIKTVLREEDILARFGGEEFCIVLTETSGVEARVCARRCLKVVSDTPFLTAAGEIESTISIGIGVVRTTMTCEELIKVADDNLYKAKQRGRNQVIG